MKLIKRNFILTIILFCFYPFFYNFFILANAHKLFYQKKYVLAEKYYHRLFFKKFFLKYYYLNLSKIYQSQGYYKKALNLLLKNKQHNIYYYSLLCPTYYRLNKFLAAVKCQEKLVNLQPTPKNKQDLAIFYFENENLLKAKNLIRGIKNPSKEMQKLFQIDSAELKIKPQEKTLKKNNFKILYYSQYDKLYAEEILNFIFNESKKLKFIFADFSNLPIVIKLLEDDIFYNIIQENSNKILAVTINNKLYIRTPRYNPLYKSIKFTVMHEFIHLLVHLITKKPPPTWLNEGLAEYFSKDLLSASEINFFKMKILSKELFSLNKLSEKWDFNNGQDLDLAYIQSYILIDFFLQKFSFNDLKNLLVKCNTEDDFSKIFFSATKFSLENFVKEWQDFLKKKYS